MLDPKLPVRLLELASLNLKKKSRTETCEAAKKQARINTQPRKTGGWKNRHISGLISFLSTYWVLIDWFKIKIRRKKKKKMVGDKWDKKQEERVQTNNGPGIKRWLGSKPLTHTRHGRQGLRECQEPPVELSPIHLPLGLRHPQASCW